MYLFTLLWIFFCKNYLKKFRKKYIFFNISFFIYLIELIFYKKINLNFIEIYKNNNFIWDYVLILNNNNKSILLFIVILQCFILFYFYKNKIKYYLIITYLIIYYISNNTKIKNIIHVLEHENNLNINLINGLVIIHPICMYILYIYFILIIIYYNNKNNNLILKNVISKLNYKVFYSFLALFLGSYWSQQELNWGGWWNWDFVEIIAFIFFLLSSTLLHVNIFKYFNYLKWIIQSFLNYFLLFFFIIRLDVINSIHSFSVFKSSNFNLNLLLFLYIIFIIIIVILNNNNYNKYYDNNKNINVLTFMFLLLLLLFNIYIYINIIMSYYFNIQFTELTKYLKNLINSFVFINFIYLIKKKNILILFNIIPIILSKYYLIFLTILLNIKIIINNYKYNYKNIFHIFIIIFIIINNYFYILQYSIKLGLIKSNLILLNNISILNDFKNHLIYLYYYNNNNYLFKINNYYCYNNKILFNRIFNEILLNNILYNKDLNIIYKIDLNFINFLYNKINVFFVYCIIIAYLLANKMIFKEIHKKKDNIV